jgi:hypothetical protein
MRLALQLQLTSLGMFCGWTGWSATLHASVIEDHSGHAVISAELRVASKGDAQLVADLESDGNGRFEPINLVDGDYVISVSKANYIETSIQIRAESFGESLVFRLVRCGTVAGRVTDPNGGPIGHAYMFALGGPETVYARTDANGEYRVFGLAPGKYRIAVAFGQPTLAVASTGVPPSLGPSGAGVLFYPEELTVVSGDEHVHIDFAIASSPLFHVSGRVDAPDTPTGEYWVALASMKTPEIATSVAIAGKDRSFHFEGVPPGSYNLFVSGPSDARGLGAVLGEHPMFVRAQIEVTAQDVEGLRLRVAPALTLPILVRAGQGCSPKAHVSVSAIEDWAADLNRSAQSDENGNALLTRAAPTRFRVYAKSDLCFQATDVVADLSAASVKPVEVRMSRGASIKVHVSPSMPVILIGGGKTRAELPDAEGNVEFGGLPAGHYRLKGSEGLSKNTLEADLQAGEIQKIELDLRKPEEK